MILITIDNFEIILLCVIAILLLNGKRMPNIHKLIEMIKSARPTKSPASTTKEKEALPKEPSEIIENEKTENSSNTSEETT